MTEDSHGSVQDGKPKGLLRGWLRTLYRLTPWGLRRAINQQREATGILADRMATRAGEVDARLDAIEDGIRRLQTELEELRGERVTRLEHRVDGVNETASEAHATADFLRDTMVPAVVDRGNLLVDRLAEEIEEVSSLVERILLSEPLPVPAPSETEDRIASALSKVQPLLVHCFRGSEEEILHRLDHHLPVLQDSAPVLDLGCGRGEMLLMLREAGVEARGVELDPALAQAARRRGLDVVEGDALSALRELQPASCGAVTAIHLLEHLRPDETLDVLSEVRRVLRPGGVALFECPNPHNLRVGAALYWLDPTHRRPLLPETLELYCVASGLEVGAVEYLHPFPDEQRLAHDAPDLPANAAPDVAALAGRLERLTDRVDQLLHGPRDFALVAAKPSES
jgi:O-antigen chain-terminating methyltransferase